MPPTEASPDDAPAAHPRLAGPAQRSLLSALDTLASPSDPGGWVPLVQVRQALGMPAPALTKEVHALVKEGVLEVQPLDPGLPTSRYSISRHLAKRVRRRL